MIGPDGRQSFNFRSNIPLKAVSKANFNFFEIMTLESTIANLQGKVLANFEVRVVGNVYSDSPNR